ncbi:hypothetical protein T492DRAFT_1141764 [Pavlovales sp. CCMP2436]|nr:hypothetical protein T492DRAFT_1141764 [Pavlovales sp. CCMP2436]
MMPTMTPATSAPFQSPQTPATASPRRTMQALAGLPAVTITAPTPTPPTPPVMLAPAKAATPALTRTKSTGRKAAFASAYTEYPEAGPSKPYTEYQSPPAMSRRQMQLGELNLGLTGDELNRIGKMPDLRTRPAKSPQDENAQVSRLLNNEIILQKIIKKYGDLGSGNDIMSNVYGALDAATLDVAIDPYAITTSAVTLLSFSFLESPQNQTRDLTKVIKKKIPTAAGNDELVFPFDSTFFTAPLSYVAEVALPISLGLAVTKAVGVQWAFSKATPISEGCVFVLGDTKQLQDEATTDPKASTYTINQLVPTGAVPETTYLINVLRFIPGQTQQRNFTWSSLDTPAMVCAKWKATMEPAVAYAGFTQSFGHAVLSFENTTGKYVASFAASVEWGLFNNSIYYEIDRYSGTVIDASKRITVEILATGSQRANVRQIKYDITRFLDEQNALLPFFNPAAQYTLLFSYSDVNYDLLFYCGDTLIAVNPEGSSNVTFYNQIYKPVIRICGGAIVNNAYSGVVCPISRLSVISNEFRALTINDFINKRLPTTIGQDSFFSGDIIGRASNGDPYNIVDSLQTLNAELLYQKKRSQFGAALPQSTHVIATPAYNPTTISSLNKASPAFASTSTINSNDDWTITAGWRASSSSYYQNNASFLPFKAFDRINTTYWASAELAYTSAGVGSQWVQMDYPEAVKWFRIK